MRRHGLFFLCFVIWLDSAWGTEHEWSLGAAYTEGNYGRDSTTRIVQSPLSYTWRDGRWRNKFSVVWLAIDGGNKDTSLYPIKHAEGWSDAHWLCEYLFAPAAHWHVAVSTQLKVPLDSYRSGLSTGKPDGGPQLNLYYAAVANTTLFAQTSYWWRRDPDAIELRDRAQYLLGVYQRGSERWAAGATFEYVEASTARGRAQRNLAVFATVQATSRWTLLPYLIKGFSDTSPSWGVGMESRLRFGSSG